MYLHLGPLIVHLDSEHTDINAGWERLGAGFLSETLPAGVHPDLTLRLQPAAQVTPPEDVTPLFRHPAGLLDVYPAPAGAVDLYFRPGALVRVPLDSSSGSGRVVAGRITAETLGWGRLEDVTFAGLAPGLRRRGLFLLHACAVAEGDQASLFVGPTGSGKTTTGLALALAGRELLANDVVLLAERPEGVVALPTPGELTVRRGTLALLPALRDYLRLAGGSLLERAGPFAVAALGRERPVSRIYFPQVTGQAASTLEPESQAVTLAQLLEESADRWDQATLNAHLNCLQHLSEQAGCYRLLLGHGMAQLLSLLG